VQVLASPLVAVIMLLFIGIMVAVYVISKRANPVILDERGKPLTTQRAGGY
jgi:hypothetical protein